MVTILAPIGTEEVRKRVKEIARANGYVLKEWLEPGHNGEGLRVACTMRIKGQTHGLGFKWDGDDINELIARCIALDYAMQGLPKAVSLGKSALWTDH